jgi:hypothetical protein
MIAVAPSLVRSLDADELDRVLIHEWAHVQRRDDLVNILQVFVRIVAGWHPALWWIDRRLHIEREIACDEITVARAGSPRSYAECLMKLASLRGTRRPVQMAPAVFKPSGLRARLIRIVSPSRSLPPVWSRGIASAIVATLCLMSVGLGGLTLVEATSSVLPFGAARPLVISIPSHAAEDRPSTALAPSSSADLQTKPSPRPPVRNAPSAQPPIEEQPSRSPERPNAPVGPPTPDALESLPSTPVTETGTVRVTPEPLASEPHTTTERPEAAAEQPQSPWKAAAAGGTAIGRKSKDAGVATAGFFTRFARRVAGSF